MLRLHDDAPQHVFSAYRRKKANELPASTVVLATVLSGATSLPFDHSCGFIGLLPRLCNQLYIWYSVERTLLRPSGMCVPKTKCRSRRKKRWQQDHAQTLMNEDLMKRQSHLGRAREVQVSSLSRREAESAQP